jgi:hypothetical protein
VQFAGIAAQGDILHAKDLNGARVSQGAIFGVRIRERRALPGNFDHCFLGLDFELNVNVELWFRANADGSLGGFETLLPDGDLIISGREVINRKMGSAQELVGRAGITELGLNSQFADG